jgi:hypothetical protein
MHGYDARRERATRSDSVKGRFSDEFLDRVRATGRDNCEDLFIEGCNALGIPYSDKGSTWRARAVSDQVA